MSAAAQQVVGGILAVGAFLLMAAIIWLVWSNERSSL